MEFDRKELLKEYDSVGDLFYEGLIQVCKNKKWFHILPNGKPAYEERYDWVGDFHEGLARAWKDNEAFHICKDGKPAYKERYYWVGDFSLDGIAKVLVFPPKDDKELYINKDGTRVQK